MRHRIIAPPALPTAMPAIAPAESEEEPELDPELDPEDAPEEPEEELAGGVVALLLGDVVGATTPLLGDLVTVTVAGPVDDPVAVAAVVPVPVLAGVVLAATVATPASMTLEQ